eukprot:5568308-Pyramimonas_sp.AAC.1
MSRAKRGARKSRAKRAGPPRARRFRAPSCGGLLVPLGASWGPPRASSWASCGFVNSTWGFLGPLGAPRGYI